MMKTIFGAWSQAPNGLLVLQLSKYALIGGTAKNAPRFYRIRLDASGAIPTGQQIVANDQIMPEGTQYQATIYDANSNIVFGPQMVTICGPDPINLNQVIVVSTAPPPQVSVSISPTSATLQSGQTQQFTVTVTNTANHAVTFAATLGTITAGGLYTAPTVTTTTAVTVAATSVVDPSKSASAFLSIQPAPAISVSISPGSATLAPGGTQQFHATVAPAGTNQAVTWTATDGTITSAGLFTAANVGTATTGTVTATSVIDTSKSATVSVSIQPVAVLSVTVTPQTVTVAPGGTQQFNAVVNNSVNQGVNWSTTVGTITSGGLYTAPSSVTVTTSATIVAVAQADVTVHGQATVIIPLTAAVSISPTTLTLGPAQQQQFTAVITPSTTSQAVTWSVSAAGGLSPGTISSTGLYTAPSNTTYTNVTVKAVSVAVPSESASVVFTVSPIGTGVTITVAPVNPVMTVGQQLTFSAVVHNSTDQSVIWSSTAGLLEIGGGGTFQAQFATTATVTATWATSVTPPVTGSTTVTINPVTTTQPLDLVQWMIGNQRTTQHLAGDPHAPYSVQVLDTDSIYPAGYPRGTIWQIKNKLGHPWDIRRYDTAYIHHWITENGDSVDNPACQTANGTTCWLYVRAYKRFVTPLRGWPRYLTPGTPVTIDSPGPNTTNRTVDCEAHLTGTITLGDVRTVTSGPTKYTWGGNIDKGAGSTTSGPRLDSVNGVETVVNLYYYSGTIANNDFKDREEYYYVLGFGEVAWYYYHRSSATAPWTWVNQTVNSTLASGGAPAPSFPCGAGKTWWV